MTKPLVFRIGPWSISGHSYEVANPPAPWMLVGEVAMCTVCGKTLHLIFDSPPHSGTATCGCAPLNNRGFKILK